jgi:hypothetical protein
LYRITIIETGREKRYNETRKRRRQRNRMRKGEMNGG